MAYIKALNLEVQAMTPVSATSRYDSPAEALLGSNNLIDQVRNARNLLALANLIEIENFGLPLAAIEGFRLILDQVLDTLERAEYYLAKEQRIVELCQTGTEMRP